MWASAIFVETGGIPPKIIYRSVKSYKLLNSHTRAFRLDVEKETVDLDIKIKDYVIIFIFWNSYSFKPMFRLSNLNLLPSS